MCYYCLPTPLFLYKSPHTHHDVLKSSVTCLCLPQTAISWKATMSVFFVFLGPGSELGIELAAINVYELFLQFLLLFLTGALYPSDCSGSKSQRNPGFLFLSHLPYGISHKVPCILSPEHLVNLLVPCFRPSHVLTRAK